MKIYLLPMAILLLTASFSVAEKKVGGVILRDTRWISEEGPYIIEKDLLISPSAQLTISPGTKILIRNKPIPDTSVYQLDRVDSQTVSIKVEGILICLGKRDQRTSFGPVDFLPHSYSWYGIVFKNTFDATNELAGTDIAGAYCAISIIGSNPTIRSSVLEYNHIGISCYNESSANIFNCIIARNFTSGIFVSESNPHFANNIIAFNRNNGLWCDGASKVYLEYNCFYDNHDGDLLECDPEFGVLVKTNKNRDSIDISNNIFIDPVFAGSVSDSIATEKDINLPTVKSRVKDTTIATVLYDGKPLPEAIWKVTQAKYELSRYSPCLNAGHPSSSFFDTDGSRNDMGIGGGPDYTSKNAKTSKRK